MTNDFLSGVELNMKNEFVHQTSNMESDSPFSYVIDLNKRDETQGSYLCRCWG